MKSIFKISMIVVVVFLDYSAWAARSPKKSRTFKSKTALSPLPPHSNAWAEAQWQRVTKKSSVDSLEALLNSPQTYVDRELLFMTAARTYYKSGQWTRAMDFYNKIPKASPLWPMSLEEKAWTYVRQEKYSEALGLTKTLTQTNFHKQLLALNLAESYFLEGYIKLKTCDYLGGIQVIQNFKTHWKPRILSLENLAHGNLDRVAFDNFLKSGLAELTPQFPRFYFYDAKIKNQFKNRSEWTQKDKAKLGERLQELARVELKEISQIIAKLQLLEAEMVHRMHLQEDVTQQDLALRGLDKSEIQFPVPSLQEKREDGQVLWVQEIWSDELGQFEVAAKSCPQNSLKGKL